MTFKNRILARLGLKVFAMAQKQGQSEDFTFYTLDREQVSHYPHIHVCVNSGDKKYKGKPLENGSNLKTIVTIKLRPDCVYSWKNLEFEKIFDRNSITSENKKIWAAWLNSIHKRSKDETNGEHAVADFFNSNEDNLFESEFENLWS